MGVIHYKQDKKSLAIYAPPKCGTTLLDQLTTFPEYEGKFLLITLVILKKRYKAICGARSPLKSAKYVLR